MGLTADVGQISSCAGDSLESVRHLIPPVLALANPLLSAIGRLCEKCDGKWCVLYNFTARDALFIRLLRHAALSVIPTYALRRLSAFVTNATLALTEDDASSVVLPVRRSSLGSPPPYVC